MSKRQRRLKIPVLAERQNQGFVLLKAASFFTLPGGNLQWADSGAAAQLLQGQVNSLPADTDALVARLDAGMRQKRDKAMKTLTWDGAEFALDYSFKAFDGRDIILRERAKRVSGTEETAERVLSVLQDVTAAKHAASRATYLTQYDDVTALWNESQFKTGLNYLQSFSERYDRPAAILGIVIANMDDLNATYGYDIGDKVLRGVATRISEHVNAPDIVGRIAGDCFGVGLTDWPDGGIANLSRRIKYLLENTPYASPHGDITARVDIIGTPFGASEGQNATEALQATLWALKPEAELIADTDAQGDTELFLPTHPAAPSHFSEADIQAALDGGKLSLAYQPIVSAKTHQLHHYECLLRLRLDNDDFVSAWKFIIDAERLGLVHLLDRRALELATETLRQHPDIHVALNVSAGTVKNAEAANAYLSALKDLGDMAKRVTVELTETLALDDPATANRFSVEARRLGVDFSIDDFGSGYTTFNNLMAVEADTIKIDGSFIQDILQSPHKQTFVRMVVDMAQTFSVETVAEMVDSRDKAELLTRLGVDYLQGYLFGRPQLKPNWTADN